MSLQLRYGLARRGSEQLIADHMAEAVSDALEAIKINVMFCDFAACEVKHHRRRLRFNEKLQALRIAGAAMSEAATSSLGLCGY